MMIATEKLLKIRSQFLSELEDLFTAPSFPSTKEDFVELRKAQDNSDYKFRACPVFTDKVARISNDQFVWNFDDLHKVYNFIFESGWQRLCSWARLSIGV